MTARTQTVLKRFNGTNSIIYHKNENHNIKRDLFIWKHNKSPKQIEETENAFVSKVIELVKSGKQMTLCTLRVNPGQGSLTQRTQGVDPAS